MEMPISYSVCAQIPSDGKIWSNQTRYWANFKKAVRTKRCGNHRSTGLFGSHPYMLLSIPPKYSVSQIMGYLKGKSSLMIFDRHANLKYKYGDRHFWARGYYVDTVGRNKKQIQEYIKHQLEEDQIADQMSLREFVDPFTGSKNSKA